LNQGTISQFAEKLASFEGAQLFSRAVTWRKMSAALAAEG
jgi:hypothetical protein